jgi:hypothetical protein
MRTEQSNYKRPIQHTARPIASSQEEGDMSVHHSSIFRLFRGLYLAVDQVEAIHVPNLLRAT